MADDLLSHLAEYIYSAAYRRLLAESGLSASEIMSAVYDSKDLYDPTAWCAAVLVLRADMEGRVKPPTARAILNGEVHMYEVRDEIQDAIAATLARSRYQRNPLRGRTRPVALTTNGRWRGSR